MNFNKYCYWCYKIDHDTEWCVMPKSRHFHTCQFCTDYYANEIRASGRLSRV